MSPFSKPVILDNTCISNFYLAESLEKVLTAWPFRVFVVPQRVVIEASNWHLRGDAIVRILVRLRDNHTIDIVSIDEESEEEMDAYIHLRLCGPVLGEGESESMAIASHRDFIVATDDEIATERCKEILPGVKVITTAQILNMAQADGLLTESEVNEMWRLIRRKGTRH